MNFKAIITFAISFITIGATAQNLVPANHDVQAMTPWEMLGQNDGLGEVKDNSVDYFTAHRSDLVDFARRYLGCRYCHGAKGPTAFDCSGFTSFVFSKFGYKLSPSSRMQGTQGKAIALKDAQPGDLMFFTSRRSGGAVGHVGMIVSSNGKGSVSFIHASSKKGITIQSYPDGGYYQRCFLQARRIVS